MRYFNLHRSPEGDGGGGPAAVAPAAPAPAPAAPAVPSLAPAPTPLQLAVEAARSQIAEREAQAAQATTQPRADNGQFVAAPAGQGGETPPVDATAPAEGTEPPAGEAPAESATDDAGEALFVEIPGRREEDGMERLPVATPEQAERVRQLVNGYYRGRELQQRQMQLASEQNALNEIRTRIQIDPEGFLFDEIPADRAASVALQVMLQPDVWSQMEEMLTELAESAEKREIVRVTLENERLRNRDKVAERLEAQRESARNAETILSVIANMVPETLPEQDQIALYTACRQDVAEYANRHGLATLDPRDVPLVIAQRFREAGLDPVALAASVPPRVMGGKAPNGSARTSAARSVERPARPAQPTGQDFVRAASAARTAAVAVPPGAGVPSSAAMPKPDPTHTWDQRVEWARQNLRFTRDTTK